MAAFVIRMIIVSDYLRPQYLTAAEFDTLSTIFNLSALKKQLLIFLQEIEDVFSNSPNDAAYRHAWRV